MNWITRIAAGAHQAVTRRHLRAKLRRIRYDIERHHQYLAAACETLDRHERDSRIVEAELFAIEHPHLFHRNVTRVYNANGIKSTKDRQWMSASTLSALRKAQRASSEPLPMQPRSATVRLATSQRKSLTPSR